MKNPAGDPPEKEQVPIASSLEIQSLKAGEPSDVVYIATIEAGESQDRQECASASCVAAVTALIQGAVFIDGVEKHITIKSVRYACAMSRNEERPSERKP